MKLVVKLLTFHLLKTNIFKYQVAVRLLHFDMQDNFTYSRPRFDAIQRLNQIKSWRKEAATLPDQYFSDDLAFCYKYPKFHFKVNPLQRTLNTFKKDFKRIFKEGRSSFNEFELFPTYHTDVVIIGGGLLGSSISYFLKQKVPDSLNVVVIERDPKYIHAISTSSFGGIRQQFSIEENIQMSLFGIDFLKNLETYLSILDYKPPDICFNPHGYLILHDQHKCEEMLNHQKLQNICGAYVDALSKDELNIKFPWLNTDDILLGTLGVQDEGWFDPSALLYSLKAKSEFLGTHYVTGEVIDFNVKKELHSSGIIDEFGNPPDIINHLLVRLPNGTIEQMEFTICFVMAGAQNKEIIDMLNIDNTVGGIRSALTSIKPKYFYVFETANGPGLSFPVLVDISGVICRREGLGDRYIVTKNPTEEEEPDASNLDVDYNYFESVIKPILKKRVKSFQNIELVTGWASFQDVNTHDQCPVIGMYPYYHNIFVAAGLGGTSIQMAPAVGRAMSELFLEGNYKSIDLNIFSWERITTGFKLLERLNL